MTCVIFIFIVNIIKKINIPLNFIKKRSLSSRSELGIKYIIRN